MAETKQFWKQKTFYAGMVVFACGGLAALGYDVPTEMILGMLGLQGLFIRHGIKK